MTPQTIIRSACYLCEGTIEFPAELANQIIPCPHCGKEIKLFAASKSLSRVGGFKGWNLKQTAVVVLAVIGLLVSLFNAPWEITYRDAYNSLTKAEVVFGPVFQPPVTYRSEVTGHRLLAMPLVFGWCGIAAVTGLLLLLLRTRVTPLFSPRQQEHLKHEINAALKVLPWLASGVGILVVVLFAAERWHSAVERQRRAKTQSQSSIQAGFDPSKPYEIVTNDTPKWEDTFAASTCCGKAAAAGKQCEHACCVKARQGGSICRACNPVRFNPNDFTAEPQ
jgi:hypothetical protein